MHTSASTQFLNFVESLIFHVKITPVCRITELGDLPRPSYLALQVEDFQYVRYGGSDLDLSKVTVKFGTDMLNVCAKCHETRTLLFTRDSIYAIARICHANSVRPSVCHTRVLYQTG